MREKHIKRSFEPGAQLGSYRIKRVEPFSKMNGQYIELEHEPTGARHIHLAVPDTNKAFGVAFPTIPQDSTGVAHILEHIVLAGSKRFPAREMFFSMFSRSLSTFMNAMTGQVYTMYPFSTRIEKDFFNLLEVYLDAVLFPLLAEHSFAQEGHRFAIDGGNLIFKGVVFNEMKAANSTESRQMLNTLQKAVFPNLPYVHDSGGDPREIPNLTLEDLRAFHRKYYHPSNAFFYTYGDLALEPVLARIDQIITPFGRAYVDARIDEQEHFVQPVSLRGSYPITADEVSKRQSQAAVVWKTVPLEDTYTVLAMDILSSALLNNAASPLRRALLESGLGSALAHGTGLHPSTPNTMFSVGLRNVRPEDAERVESLVLETLAGLAREGVPTELVDGVLHRLELSKREISNAGMPYALRLFFETVPSYLFGSDPYRVLEWDEDLRRIEHERHQGLFERLIREQFLENTHRARVLLEPDTELTPRLEQQERDKLAQIQAHLSSGELEQIRAYEEELTALQRAVPDLSALPTLELSDISDSSEDVPGTYMPYAGGLFGVFAQPTQGLVYVDLEFDLAGVDAELYDLLPFFAYALTRSNAGSRNYLELAQKLELYTGGISAQVVVRAKADEPGMFRQTLVISGMALSRKRDDLMDLLGDVVLKASFEPERLKRLALERAAALEASVINVGHTFAASLAVAQCSTLGAVREHLFGITQVKLATQLAQLSAEGLETLVRKLERLRSIVLGVGMNACVTAEAAILPEMTDHLKRLADKLPAKTAGAPRLPALLKHVLHGHIVSSPVAYNALALPGVRFTEEDAPAMQVFAALMKTRVLHNEVREQGGAYGVQVSADGEQGLVIMRSYRDPNVSRTFDVFQRAPRQALALLEPSNQSSSPGDPLKEAILYAYTAFDPLESPDTKARTRFFDRLAGFDPDFRETFKKKLLAITPSDLQRVCERYFHEQAFKQAGRAVLGNEARLEEARQMAHGVMEIVGTAEIVA